MINDEPNNEPQEPQPTPEDDESEEAINAAFESAFEEAYPDGGPSRHYPNHVPGVVPPTSPAQAPDGTAFSDLPDPFYRGSDGIYEMIVDTDTSMIADYIKIVSQIDLIGEARTLDVSKNRRLLKVWNSSNEMTIMPFNAVSAQTDTNKFASEIGERGGYVGNHHIAKLRFLMHAWRTDNKLFIATRSGWLDVTFDTYVFPDGHVYGLQQAVLDADANHGRTLLASDRAAGSVQGWRNSVGKLAEGNKTLEFAIALSFAAPLLRVLNLQPMGFNLLGESSKGKTTVLKAASSIWRQSDTVVSWRTTVNGVEGHCKANSDTGLVLDEMGNVQKHQLGEGIYTIMNGISKLRANQLGGSNNVSDWRLTMLSSSEVSTEQLMRQGGTSMMAGQEVRMVDLNVVNQKYGVFDKLHDHDDAPALINALEAAIAAQHGHPSRAFVAGIIKNMDAVVRDWAAYAKDFTDEFTKGYTGTVETTVLRVARNFAAVAYAGKLAAQWGVVPWVTDAARKAAMHWLKGWVVGRGGTEQLQERQVLERIIGFISENATSRFVASDAGFGLNRVGYRWRVGPDGDNGEADDITIFALFPSIWHNEVFKDLDSKKAVQILADCGYLYARKGKGRGYTIQVPAFCASGVPSKPTAYCIDSRILQHFTDSNDGEKPNAQSGVDIIANAKELPSVRYEPF